MSVPNRLIPAVVCPLQWNSLELTQALVRDVGVYEGDFVPPMEQHPPPLVVLLKSHDGINESKLVSKIIIVHLLIVIIGQAPPLEGEVNILLEAPAPHLLVDRLPSHTLAA